MAKGTPPRDTPPGRKFNITGQPDEPKPEVISTRRRESKRDATVRVAEGRWDKFEVGLDNMLKLFEHPENYEFTPEDFEAMEKRGSELFNLLIEAVRNHGRPRRLKLKK